MQQQVIFLTVSQGKKLIAKGISLSPEVERAARKGTLVIVAGTTNQEVACKILERFKLKKDISNFYRGVTVPAGCKTAPPTTEDIIIRKGLLIEGKTIFDIAPELTEGDMILKGGNALSLEGNEAAVLVGNPKLGTTLPITEAAYGRRVSVMIPIGLEKRVDLPIRTLCALSCLSETTGPRLAPLPGDPFTEIDALFYLYDIEATLLASGGIMGAEGGIYLLCTGEDDALRRFKSDLKTL